VTRPPESVVGSGVRLGNAQSEQMLSAVPPIATVRGIICLMAWVRFGRLDRVPTLGARPPRWLGGGRYRRPNAGQGRLQRRFLGVVKRGLHHCAALALEALKHLVSGDLTHQHE
jgi:hypothetical protein